MAKVKISEFSTTAGNNTDINSINIAEGCAPSGINDAIRELMRQLKEFQTGGAGDSVNSGGDFSVATNKFTVASASGNTSVAGTLGVTGAATLSSTLAVTGTTTLTGALVANGNATLGDASGDTVTIKGTPTLEVNPTLSGGTANGVLYLNGSKVATSGSALTFDGSSLTVFGGGAIKGNKNASGQFLAFVAQNSTQNYGTYIDQDNAGSNSWSLFDTTNSQTALRYYPSTSGYWQFYVNNSEAMRLTSSSLYTASGISVGIGTSSPQTRLEANQTGVGSVVIPIVAANQDTSTTGTGAGIGFVVDGVNDVIGAQVAGIRTAGAYHASALAMYTLDGAGGGLLERARIDSSGNLGLGVTPSAWRSGAKAFQLGNTGYASLNEQANGSTSLNFNCYESASNTWTYYVTGVAPTRYTQLSGAHAWYTAASGTAGDAITFTQAATLTANGNYLLGTTSDVSTVRMQVWSASSDNTAYFRNSNATPYGPSIKYTAATPNNTGSEFLFCEDSTALRVSLRSNGGIANYSANDVNLSDERTKTDIKNAGNYLEKICAIPVRTFKYKDQADNLLNLGVIAQEVETVAPELVDTSGFGNTPEDGIPLKSIYQTDMQYALMKALQELKAEFDAYKASHP